MTWSGPELVLQAVDPRRATVAEVQGKLQMTATGSGFDTGVALGFIPSGQPLSPLRTLSKFVIEARGVKVVSGVELSFYIKEKKPAPGNYDAVLVQRVKVTVDGRAKRTIMISILARALKITD